jgi:hypothetical protein
MSRNLSSSNLFHFTKKNSLKLILKNKLFYALYSEEDVFKIIFDKDNEQPQYIPMVCFCNIPLTMIEKHSLDYYPYGIGLKSKWIIENKINPVLYSYSQSAISNFYNDTESQSNYFFTKFDSYFQSLFPNLENLDVSENDFKVWLESINESTEKIEILKNLFEYRKRIFRLYRVTFKKPLLFFKPLSGKNKKKKDTSYYDEKEWRYVPQLNDFENITISKKKIEEDGLQFEINGVSKLLKSKKELNKSILNNSLKNFESYKLTFELSDVEFIILKKNDEIIEMVEFIIKSFSKKNNELTDELKILISKIITIEQLKSDF